MEQTNKFIKGIVSNLDKGFWGSNVWTFPSLNIRVITKGDQGFIITPNKGNTKVDVHGNIIDQG